MKWHIFSCKLALIVLTIVQRSVKGCDAVIFVPLPTKISVCPDLSIAEDLTVGNDLCISGTMTTSDGNVTILGTDTLCQQSVAVDSLAVTDSMIVAAAIKSTPYHLLNRFEEMRSNREITNILHFADQLDPIVTTSDLVGGHVAISADGSVAVATSGNTTFDTGRVYIFRRSATTTGSVWSCVQLFAIANATFELDSIALSGDGSVILVGVSGLVINNQVRGGALLYTYNRSTQLWALTQTIENPNPFASSNFGTSVSISHDAQRLAVSDSRKAIPRVYIYVRNGTSPCTAIAPLWSLQQTLSSSLDSGFGTSVSLSPEGSFLLVGSPTLTGNSRAQLYQRTGTTWQIIQTLTALGDPPSFGRSVDLAENARYAAIYTDDFTITGSIILYGMDHALQLQEQARFAVSVGFLGAATARISYDGTRAAINPGLVVDFTVTSSIHVFERYDSSWRHTASLTRPPHDGRSIDLSGDGSYIIWGQPRLNFPQGGAAIFSPVADLIVTDLMLSGSACMEQLVTVTGSLFVAGTITHSGSLGSGIPSSCAEPATAPPTIPLAAQIIALAQRHRRLYEQ